MARMDFMSVPQALDGNGDPVSGGKLYVYQAGTTTPVTTYSDSGLASAQAHPIIADSAGRFASVYVPFGDYKWSVKTAADVTIFEADDISVTSSAIIANVLPEFSTVALLIADTTMGYASTDDIPVAAGDKVMGGVFAYLVAASGATDHDRTTAGGVKLYVQDHFGFVMPEQFGAVKDGSTNDAAAIQAAVDSGKPVRFGVGTYACNTQITFPEGASSIAGTGKAWSADYAPVMIGAGINLTTITTTIASGYVFATHNMDGAQSTQYQGFTAEGFTVRGPGTGTASGFGIANTRMASFRGLKILGFPGGAGIKIYAEDTGGAYNATIENCYLGERVKIGASDVFGLSDDVYENTLRYAIWLNGANYSGGSGVNDVLVSGCQIKNFLCAGLYIDGHGAVSASDDSSANIRSIANHYYAKPARALEEVQPTAATATTITFPAKAENDASGTYDGMRVYIKSGIGQGQWREISTDVVTAGTRVLTLTSAWTTTPGLTTEVDPDDVADIEIRWADAEAISKFGLENFPSGIYVGSAITVFELGSQFEDTSPPILLSADTKDEHVFFPNTVRNSDGVGIKHLSSTNFGISLFLNNRGRGLEGMQTHSGLPGYTLLRSQGDLDANGAHGTVRVGKNDHGSDLEPGDVCLQRSDGAHKLYKTDTANADLPKVVTA